MVAEVKVFIDGRAAESAAPTVSVFDRGFLYGDSVFETMRTYEGRVFALEEHLARLEGSAQAVLLKLPLSRAELRAELEFALSTVPRGEYSLRLMVTRGSGSLGLDPGLAGAPLRVLFIVPLQPPSAQLLERGIAVSLWQGARIGDAAKAQGAKIGNYLSAVLALAEAKKTGCLEALFLDEQGRVLEGASSNVFWFEGETLCTTPVEAGILDGITRRHLLTVATSLGLSCSTVLRTAAELIASGEVFISSSIRELLPVVSLGGQVVGQGQVGQRSLRLRQAFQAYARAQARSDW